MAGGEHYRAIRADSRRIGPVHAVVSGQQGEPPALRAITDNTVMGHIGDIECAMLIDHDPIAIPADLTRGTDGRGELAFVHRGIAQRGGGDGPCRGTGGDRPVEGFLVR